MKRTGLWNHESHESTNKVRRDKRRRELSFNGGTCYERPLSTAYSRLASGTL
jgi:hypothetical protein